MKHWASWQTEKNCEYSGTMSWSHIQWQQNYEKYSRKNTFMTYIVSTKCMIQHMVAKEWIGPWIRWRSIVQKKIVVIDNNASQLQLVRWLTGIKTIEHQQVLEIGILIRNRFPFLLMMAMELVLSDIRSYIERVKARENDSCPVWWDNPALFTAHQNQNKVQHEYIVQSSHYLQFSSHLGPGQEMIKTKGECFLLTAVVLQWNVMCGITDMAFNW